MPSIKEISPQDCFLVTNIQRFSVNDGPGIRTTVFLKGCPLRCAWCHNPETHHPYQEFYFDSDKCKRCGTCVEACPEQAIIPPRVVPGAKPPENTFYSAIGQAIIPPGAHHKDVNDLPNDIIDPPRFERDKCTRCMKCVEACRNGALSLVARPMTVPDVIAELKKDDLFYRTSGGGITLSGGEPMVQPDVTLTLLKRAKEEGFHTTLDTTGLVPWDIIEQIVPFVDLFLFDLKVLDDVKHKKWTGVSNKLIIENVRRLAKLPTRIRLRSIVIHNVNYWDLSHAKSIAQFAQSLGRSVTGIDLIPFHNFGETKYERLGIKYAFKGFPNLYPEDVADYKEVFMANCDWEPTIGGLIGREKAEADRMTVQEAESA